MSDARKARTQLHEAAGELRARAADKHAEGMALVRSAARLEQLAEIGTDDLVIDLRNKLVSEGMIVVPVTINAVGGSA